MDSRSFTSNSALIVADLQTIVSERFDEKVIVPYLKGVADLITAAREVKVPIIYTSESPSEKDFQRSLQATRRFHKLNLQEDLNWLTLLSILWYSLSKMTLLSRRRDIVCSPEAI